MTAFKGTGTCSSPYSISSDDDGDSENEVIEALCRQRSLSLTVSPSPQLPASRLLEPDLRDSESVHIDEKYRSRSPDTARPVEIGMKRKRSESVVSMDCQSDDSADANGEAQASSATTAPNLPGPGKSRKAKKRRMKAAAKKDLYLERLSRLTHNPTLVPQYQPNQDPAEAATMSPFAFLPQFHSQLLNLNFLPTPPTQPPTQPYIDPTEQSMAHNVWPMPIGGNLFLGQPPVMYNERSPWGFPPMNIPPAADIPSYQPLASSMMAFDPPPTSAQVELYPFPPNFFPKSTDIIGMEPDNNPKSKHGLYVIPENTLDQDNKPYIPTPTCTLVLEQLPKLNRTQEWIANWSISVSQTHPAKILIDTSGKALVEFPCPEAAHKAWSSPRLGIANLGLKQYQLKGRPRDDLIRAHWYRVEEISAGAGEIEEGEIEEAVGKASVLQKPGKRGAGKKPRIERPVKREVDIRTNNARPLAMSHNLGIGTFASNSGLPQRPILPPTSAPRPVYPPVPSVPLSAPVPTNGDASYRPIQTNDGDDMDISPPPTASILSNVMDPKVPLGPRAMYPRPEQQMLPKVDVVPPGLAPLPGPYNTAPGPAAADSTALEADLRKQVQKSKRVGVDAGGASPMALDDVDSFIASALGGATGPTPPPQAPRPPPSLQAQDKAQEKAELAARALRVQLELARLRARGNARRPSEQNRPSPALTGSSSELIRPSPRLGLDHVPGPVQARTLWFPDPGQTKVVIVSDGEDDDEGYEDEGEDA
ncbi:hypothetical protein EST38_g10325 [Candolleomyces aberdarensis]|uniref:Uncharacterized protein n=1 Tax=Candolleomyces aberdarensis TaxID=2316362 RepID=A0A4Q2DAJ2_9AGAR|nr:hypothetical protein EST38_g10325 [Candolleomyces aberdarensis]